MPARDGAENERLAVARHDLKRRLPNAPSGAARAELLRQHLDNPERLDGRALEAARPAE